MPNKWMPDNLPPLPDGEKKKINDQEIDKNTPKPVEKRIDIERRIPPNNTTESEPNVIKRGVLTEDISTDTIKDARDQFDGNSGITIKI